MAEMDTTFGNGFTISSDSLRPHSFVIQLNGKAALTFKEDGSVVIGEGLQPDEVGRRAIEAMQSQLQFMVAAATDAEMERCCQLIYGHASSDNVAFRTVKAIRDSKGR